jgi:hypothetical protein
MDVDYIDPSLAIGFFCKDRAAYADLSMRLAGLSREHVCPVSMADAKPDYAKNIFEQYEGDIHSMSGDSSMGEHSEDDDYVMIL